MLELQQLVLSGLPEHMATLGPEFWDAAWWDMAELVERGSLSCCSFPRAQSSTRRNYNFLNVHQVASTEQVCVCAYGHMHTGMPHTQCKTQARCLHCSLRHGPGSSLQHHGDATVGKPGCFHRQDLMATKPAEAKNEGGKAASRAVEDASVDRLSSRPPAEDCIVLCPLCARASSSQTVGCLRGRIISCHFQSGRCMHRGCAAVTQRLQE